MNLYANINLETKICYAISNTAEPIEGENIIPLDPFNSNVLGKKWNGTDWEEVPQPEPLSSTPEQEPTT